MKARLPALLTIAICTFVTFATGQTTQSAPNRKTPPASSTEAMYQAAAKSADRKFRHIESNGQRANPDQTPTVLTEREINAYVNGGYVRLPKGVKKATFSGSQGSVTTDATVDFDAITQGRQSSNPLLSLFRGVHQVQVVSHGEASGGEAHIHIDSASIDGVGVPRIALQYFADKYIKPRYPNLGLDSTVKLPARVDTATVGDHNLTITQK